MVVDTAAEATVMMTCPSVVILVVLPMEDLACYDGMDCLVGAVRGLGMGMSMLEISISTTRAHSSPLRPIAFMATHSVASPSVGRGNGTIGSGAGGGPRGPRSAAGDSSSVDRLLGFSFRVGGGAGNASGAHGATATATAAGGAGTYASRYT